MQLEYQWCHWRHVNQDYEGKACKQEAVVANLKMELAKPEQHAFAAGHSRINTSERLDLQYV